MLEGRALGWDLGRYTLHGQIASGGMATVHIGRMLGSAGFTKVVAIKRLHAEYASDPSFVAMFLDEARLAARVHHPNVVQPLDVIADQGEVFLVMEYVRGESLAKVQRLLGLHGQRAPLAIAGAIMVGVLHGLHAAHEATSERGTPLGIVHRDVSPHNVVVGTDGTARVLDFGIAKASDRLHNTRDGQLKGKLAYMAPEQLSRESDVDRRTDIFAASIVLWELLTGQRIHDADARGGAVERPSGFAPEVPPVVDEVVAKGLARDPADRFASAREMAIALEMAMPVATPSKVGEWLESIASESLQRRAARIAEIEQGLVPGSAHEGARALLHELRASHVRDTAPAADDSSPELEASAILVEPLSPVSSAELPRQAQTRLDPRRIGRRLVGLALAGLAVGIAAFLVPVFVKRSYVRAAAKHGIALRVDAVDLSLHRVRLLGCTATFPEMPGVMVYAKALTFSSAKTRALRVDQPEIAINGAYAPILDALSLYLSTHPLAEGGHAVERIEIARGRLAWAQALGENTKLELDGIHGESVRTADRGLGQDYAFDADQIAVRTSLGTFGPWRGTLMHTAASLVANVSSVEAAGGGEPATASYVEEGVDDSAGSGLATFEVKVPRKALERAGVPKALILGLAAGSESLDVEGTVRGVWQRGMLEVQSAFAFYGPVNVRFQGRVVGDPDAVLPIDGGVMTFGAFRARLWGNAAFAHDGFKLEGGWRSAPRPCAAVRDPEPEISVPELAADLAGLERAVAAPIARHQMAVGGVFLFDSRDPTRARVTAVPSNPCR